MCQRFPKPIARAVQENPQVIPIHLKFAAYYILIFLVEKHTTEQLPIFLVHFPENPPHQFAALARRELAFGSWACVFHFGSVAGNLVLARV